MNICKVMIAQVSVQALDDIERHTNTSMRGDGCLLVSIENLQDADVSTAVVEELSKILTYAREHDFGDEVILHR